MLFAILYIYNVGGVSFSKNKVEALVNFLLVRMMMMEALRPYLEISISSVIGRPDSLVLRCATSFGWGGLMGSLGAGC